MAESRPDLPSDVQSRLIRLLDEPEEAFALGVDALCAEKPALAATIRAEASSLLRAARSRTVSRPEPGSEVIPAHIGPFRILAEVGRGGMGTVYLAERGDLKQRVALKVIKLGMDTKAVLARFDAERAALSRMEHAHIARVLDAGATDRGQPWFAMEYVKGDPITRYCDKQRLSIEERLRLFQQVCSGVQHAHAKGVVHRDLTPNNILVTVQEGKAAAKIIDFGLAKATDRQLTDKTIFTEQGLILGTPEYMAPEQAGIGALDVDTRADVYTLGVLLYELLVGALPFSRDELRAAGWDGMCKTIQDTDPPRPSTKITEHAATRAIVDARRTDASALRRRLRGDLDWVVMKCLEKDRTRRYETPTELAADVQRHLDFEPVLAHAPSFGYRLRKFARRYRGQVASATVVFLAVFGALVTAVVFWQEADAQATEAERQKGIAEGQTRAAETARAGEAAMAREASENAATAQRNASLLAAKVRDFDQLAGIVRLERLQVALEELAAPWKDLTAARNWLADAESVLALQPQLQRTVDDLRIRQTALAEFLAARTNLRRRIASGEGEAARRELSRLEEEGHALLEAPEAHRFLLDALAGLIGKLTVFASAQYAGLHTRLRCALWTENHPRARATWQRAAEAIAKADGIVASTLYKEHPIALRPQMGLVPIGMNPVTKLWEFYELRSAWDPETVPGPEAVEIPREDTEGRIQVGDDTGIVFALLPGGTFMMGAQRTDTEGANYDPHALDAERPHLVTLAPFFLARHELTEGQWRRLGGKRDQQPHRITSETDPIVDVDWFASDALLRARGLSLPAEAQWEYGCRATTTTPWWTETDPALLADTLTVPGPVGSGRSNAFGLFGMHDNVWEWCADQWGSSPNRVYRGGYDPTDPHIGRSAFRYFFAPTFRFPLLGIRPARALRLDD